MFDNGILLPMVRIPAPRPPTQVRPQHRFDEHGSMSTAGNYGERRTWRRETNDQGARRRTTKFIVTLLAAALLAWFIFLILKRRPNPQLRTILVSNQYDADIVTPVMFPENVLTAFNRWHASLSSKNGLKVLKNHCQLADLFTDELESDEDNVMIVLRGYLMRDREARPAIACSQLSATPVNPRSDDTTPVSNEPAVEGLVSLVDLLQPLANRGPSTLDGNRFVILDIEPMSAHPLFAQRDDLAFAALETAVQSVTGPHADRVWVLVTRGPVQNVGWDHEQKLPIATATLLEALAGHADLGEADGRILLSELFAYMTERYRRLPFSADVDAPTPVLLRGGIGALTASDIRQGVADQLVSFAPPPKPAEDEQSANTHTPETQNGGPAGSDADPESRTTSRPEPAIPIRHVALQDTTATESTDAPRPGATQTGTSDQPSADAVSSNAVADATSQESNPGVPDASAERASFWELKQQFEAVPLKLDKLDRMASPIAIAPHLWRQIVLEVLGHELMNLDVDRPSGLPERTAEDLQRLIAVLHQEPVSGAIDDDDVSELADLAVELAQTPRRQFIDDNVRAADRLQHAIAAGKLRVWYWLEYQREAVLCGINPFDHGLDKPLADAELLLGTAGDQATARPDNAEHVRRTLETQHGRLLEAIVLFDRTVARVIETLVSDMTGNDPAETWELTRRGWALLRSPLPQGIQRATLLRAIRASSVASSPLDQTEIHPHETPVADITATSSAVDRLDRLVANYEQFAAPPDTITGNAPSWWRVLSTETTDPFTQRFAASLRVDPRIRVPATYQSPIVHRVEAKPVIETPDLAITTADGRDLKRGDVLQFDALGDRHVIKIRLEPHQPQRTRLLVRYEVAVSGDRFGKLPVDVRWSGNDPSVTLSDRQATLDIAPGDDGELSLTITATQYPASDETVSLNLQIRGETERDQIENLVGSHAIPVAMPKPNLIRIVASAHGGVGCSAPSESGSGRLENGIWLRTFNARPTPFQLQIFNDAGKPCRANVWLIRLPSPMPDAVREYWPNYAANRYAQPPGGLWAPDENGQLRIREDFLSGNRVIKSRSNLAIPSGRDQRVKLDFAAVSNGEQGSDENQATADTAPPASPGGPDEGINVEHGLGLVARMVDAEGNVTQENDQIIFLVANPWAPSDYVQVETTFVNDRVQIRARLKDQIDGDDEPDNIPELEQRDVELKCVQDDQWVQFEPSATTPPREIKETLKGTSWENFSIQVNQEGEESWIHLDVDGWPRAIRHVVAHQPDQRGAEGSRNALRFSRIEHTRPKRGDAPADSAVIYDPSREVAFRGGGEQLIPTLRADFATEAFVPEQPNLPAVRLRVRGNTEAIYHSDRAMETLLTNLTDDGVLTLLTHVSDLREPLGEGGAFDDRVPLAAEMFVADLSVGTAELDVVLDSKPPNVRVSPRDLTDVFVPDMFPFAITVDDLDRRGSGNTRRYASGVKTVTFGLDEIGKGPSSKHVFSVNAVSPTSVPADKTRFKVQIAGPHHIVAKAVDAAGNESEEVSFYFDAQGKPQMTAETGQGGKEDAQKMGWLHGEIDYPSGVNGTLTLSPAPPTLTRNEKSIVGQDLSFDFGPLPEGKYTLRFRGSIDNRLVRLVWPDLEIDTTDGKKKDQSLDPTTAKRE